MDIKETGRNTVDGGKKVAVYSAIINTALSIAKVILAMLSGSAAVLSEAIHSLTDVLGNLTVVIGISISRKKSPDFPWGLYKVENIVAIISSLFIFFVAYELIKNSFITDAREIANAGISSIILGVLIIPVYLFARYEKKKAKQLNSPSLMADSQHWMTDIVSLGVVIAGLITSRYFPYADKGAALIVIVIVLNVGYKIFKNSMRSLLDASVDAETLRKIREIVNGFNEVKEIVSLHARNSGSFIFVHIDLMLSVKTLKQAHQIADSLESAIKKEITFMERVSIHYEPIKKEELKFAVPLDNREGYISEHFGKAPYIALWNKRVMDNTVISTEVIKNPFVTLEKGKGIKLAEFIIEKGIDRLYIKEDFEGKGPQYTLSYAEVDLRKTDLSNVNDLMELKTEMDIEFEKD